MTTLLLHNPKAGDRRHDPEDLCALLRRAGHRVEWRSVKAPDWHAPLRDLGGISLVVVAGGDGTVAEVAAALPPGAPPLAVLPLGGANNIARSLGVTGAPEDLARRWHGGSRRRLDIGILHGPFGERPFVEAAGWGLLPAGMAMVSAGDVASGEKIATGRRVLADLAASARPRPVSLTVDDRPLPDDVLLAVAANIGCFGPSLPIAPEADPGDGVLDVAWLAAGRRAAFIDWLAAPEAAPAPLERCRARTLTLRWSHGMVNADDDFLPPPPHPATVTAALARSIEILMPDGEGETA